MNEQRKKELLLEYKNRKPEMGIISYRCLANGVSFLHISKDTKADFNSISMKLESNFHPNRELLNLWNMHGADGFEITVIKLLKYENPHEDHTAELEKLRDECLSSDPLAKKMRK